MKGKRSCLFVCLLLTVAVSGLMFSGAAMAGIEIDYQFTEPAAGKEEVSDSSGMAASYRFAKPGAARLDAYDAISMPGTHKFAERPGIPLLPIKTAKILVPYGLDVKDIRVIPGNKVVLDGTYLVEYSKTPIPTGSDQIVEDKPDPAIYGSDKPFPGKLFNKVSIQFLRGFKILILNLYPVQYIPVRGEVSYFGNMKVIVETSPSSTPPGKKPITPRTIQRINKEVDNPSAIETYPVPSDDNASGAYTLPEQPAQSYAYVIITSDTLESNFQILANHKIGRGVSATVVTTTYIYANYSGTRPDGGTDNQTRIRNFIIDAYNNWDTEYILLGGDDEIIPHRGVYGYVASLPPTSDNDIPCDLYYACLDGTWDDDADGIYGESNDGVGGGEVDLMSEVYVGRATVDTTTEADNFVSKTIAYEQATPPSSGLMTGTKLWNSPETWGGDHKDEIAAYFPSGWSITTLYDRDGNCNTTTVVNALNSNDHAIMNSAGHGNNGSFSHIDRSDVDGLTNTSYPFIYTWACYTASFDNRLTSPGNYDPAGDCIAEHFVENPTGAFAYVGNSRYGWFYAGSTSGISQQFDKSFFDALFNENITNLGKTLTDSKEDLVGSVGSTGPYRWCYFCLNLLGDPETTVEGAVAPKASVLYFSASPYPSKVSRMRGLGYDVTESTDPADLTQANLRAYDVLWIGSSTSPSFYASQDGEIRSWVSEDRGGLIVEQPNATGAVSVFPSGFEVSIDSIFLPPTYYACITDNTHPITHGLTDNDLSGNFDQVEDTSIGTAWDILARDCDDTSQIVLLAGVYGSGRLVFNTHNFSPYSLEPGSDQYLTQMLDWAGSARKTSVLLVAADNANDALAMLRSYSDLGPVNYFDARTGTPSLAQLQYYDVVLTWSNYVYDDPVAMGDVLADYVDSGGKVITNMFAMGTHGYAMEGRFIDEDYCPIAGTSINYSDASLGSYDPSHPIMQGVTAVTDHYRLADTSLTPNSRQVARWSDGELFVAVKENTTAVAITGYIGDSSVWTGDMDKVVHNSINWLMGKTSVLVVASDSDSGVNNVLAMLKAYADLGPVHSFDARTGTPSLAQLQDYRVVLTWSNYVYNDPIAMGDVLADYVDAGGKAITAHFAMGTAGWQMEGRFMDEDYCPIDGTSRLFGDESLGAYDPNHPIMQAVTNVTCYHRLDETSLTPESTEVARWTDGELFVGVKDNGTAVAIAGYLGSGWTGDMDTVVHNSINWLAAPRPVIDDISFDECISELCLSPISILAHDPAGGTLTYDWQPLNGGVVIGSGADVEFDPPDAGPHPCPYKVRVIVTSSASGTSSASIINIYVKLAGDANGDGVVNVLDKVLVRNHFGESGPPGWIDADVNCDGVVNILDKVKVRNQFGQSGCKCRCEFCEDFDDGVADDWVDDGSGLWSVQMVSAGDGEYVMEGTGIYDFRYSAYNENYTDFTYEVEVSRVSGNAATNNGIMFRSDGTMENCYLFGIAQGTTPLYMLYKSVGGSGSWITPGWVYSPTINTGLGAWNTLKVVCSDSYITLYINDTLVDAYADSEFSEGKVGVTPADVVSDDEVHYDNICLTLDTSLSVATTKTGVSATEDYGTPSEASEMSPVRVDDEVQRDYVPPTRDDIPLTAPATGW